MVVWQLKFIQSFQCGQICLQTYVLGMLGITLLGMCNIKALLLGNNLDVKNLWLRLFEPWGLF